MDIKGDIENEERVNQKVHEPQEHVGHHGGHQERVLVPFLPIF